MVHVLANNAMQRLSMLPLLLIALAGCGHDAPAAAVPPRFVADPVPEPYRSEQADFAVTTLVTGLVHPWGLAFLPDGGMLVTERPGRLRLIDKGGQISGPLEGVPRVFVEGQGGLLDVALSPDFRNDRLVYLSFAEPNLRGNLAGTAVARGRLEEGALRDVEVVYRQEPKLSAGTHLGSRLVFDDDGHLFVTQGEHRVAASAAQALDKLQGKLVRILPDGGIPPDNPFVGNDDARAEIWSFGHRNMQGAALHPQSRQLWTSEHGPMGGDELNIPQASRNYGWPLVTHGRDYDGKPVPGSVGDTAPGMEPPHHVWAVSPGLSGMAFYTGGRFPGWEGDLFMGSLARSALIRLELDGDAVVGEERLLVDRGQRIRDVREGPDGALYLLVDDAVDGQLLRLAPVDGVAPSAAAAVATPPAGQ